MPSNNDLLTFEVFQYARNHSKKFPKLSQTSFKRYRQLLLVSVNINSKYNHCKRNKKDTLVQSSSKFCESKKFAAKFSFFSQAK